MDDFQKVIAIVGQTATGKTALGIRLAQKLGGEIVSADSRQVYRGLDLGTGKVTPEETEGIPHHLIDVCEPTEHFTVHDFVRLGRAAISEIAARGKVPVVVGGTGLYVDALLGRVSLDSPAADPELRAKIANYTHEELQAELERVDPERYAKVDVANPRRLQRALEIAYTSQPASPLPTVRYAVKWLGLTLPREALQERIKTRLTARLDAGMLDEARALYARGLSYERMEELGLEYRYMARHLKGELSYEEMISKLESEIYKYAKRQMTWFKRNTDIQWFDAGSLVTNESQITDHLGGR